MQETENAMTEPTQESQERPPAEPEGTPAATDAGTAAARPADGGRKKGKYVFLALALVLVVVIFIIQLRGEDFPGWERDLDAALRRAEAEHRPVVAYFVHTTSSTPVRTQWDTALHRDLNRQAMDEAGMIRVLVETQMDSDRARAYGIEHLPTMTVLSPGGEVCRESDKTIGQTGFRNEFLEPAWEAAGWELLSEELPRPVRGRRILALFTQKPSTGAARRLAYATLTHPEVRKRLKEMKLRLVRVAVPDTKKDAHKLVKAHEIQSWPTLLLRIGREERRMEGFATPDELLEWLAGEADDGS